MPSEEKTVLPYQDMREAHAMFVLDCEDSLKFEHATESMEQAFKGGQAAQDIEEAIIDEDLVLSAGDAVMANAFSQAKPKHSRYGNAVMGPRGKPNSIPEHKDIASFTWFCRIWKRHADGVYKKTIKLRKWMPFAKCDNCSVYRSSMATTDDKNARAKLKAKQRKHLEHVKRERLSYIIRQRLAMKYPERYLSLIIDGADASPYQVPHMAHRNHASDAAPKVKMHLLGCIAHGRDTYAYTCPPHIAQGHNVTIQVLDRVLTAIKKKEGGLPPTLHLQLDNTTKQNKGKFLVAYLAMLVKNGVFREVYLNFLPVGHTHEDIDQFFSRVSVFTRRHDALCPEVHRRSRIHPLEYIRTTHRVGLIHCCFHRLDYTRSHTRTHTHIHYHNRLSCW